MSNDLPPGSFSILGVVIDWWDLLKAAVVSALTLLGVTLKARRPRIGWTATHNRLAYSVNDAVVGNLVVTLNGLQMRNLVLSKVVATNSYSRDFKDAVIRVMISPTHIILVDEAQRGGSAKMLDQTERFRVAVDAFRAAVQVNPSTPPGEITRWREYLVPVWNRGEQVEISLLSDAPLPEPASCDFSTDAEGAVTVYRKPNAPHIRGVPMGWGLFIGLLAAVPISWAIRSFVPALAQPPIFIALGGSIVGLGGLVIFTFQWLRERIV